MLRMIKIRTILSITLPILLFLATALTPGYAAGKKVGAKQERGVPSGLWNFEDSGTGPAGIDIYPKEKSKHAVSRYLYGKFAEHLWRNIYHGMWAQVILNPGFEKWNYFGRTREEAFRIVDHFLYDTGRSERVESYKKGVALGWIGYGRGRIEFGLSNDSVNGANSQEVMIQSLKAKEAGIMQTIFLPLHREGTYKVSFYAKGNDYDGKIRLSVRKWGRGNRELGSVVVPGITSEWKSYNATVKLPRVGEPGGVAKGDPLAFAVGFTGTGTINIDQVFLFPADNVDGFDYDVVRLIKDSCLPLLRYPGGNFASGYHWKDGIGPVNGRPIKINPAWHHVEYNHVGTDEFMAFCRAVGCDPMICVNAGNGTAKEAAEWLEYCNGNVNTKYGALRKENGHAKPYNVKYWEIGNELWGSWQIGNCTPEQYAERYETFYRAMKLVDPGIKIIANGQNRRWNAPLIEHKSKILRSLSIHTLVGGGIQADSDPEKVFKSLMAYTYFYEGYLKGLGRQMGEKVAVPRLAVTELQIFTNKPQLPNNATQSEALFLSGIINTCIRLNGLVELITHSALVNHGGGLRKIKEIVYANPVYFTSRLYATQTGRFPVRVRVKCPMFDVKGSRLPAVKNVPYLDVVALIDDRGKTLNLMVTNRHPEKGISTNISLHGFQVNGEAVLKTINGKSYMTRNSWEQPENVKIVNTKEEIDEGKIVYTFPPHSITLVCINLF